MAILALGGWLALHHEITLGTFLAFSTYIVQLVAPARQLAGVLTIGQQARAGIERIFQLLDLRPAIADAPDAARTAAAAGATSTSPTSTSPTATAPRCSRASTCTSPPGERVAIVGPSGSGKSTVAMLVSRFYDPDARGRARRRARRARRDPALAAPPGRRRVRGELPLLRLRCAPTSPTGGPTPPTQEIEAAARAAQAHEFITRLPRGYDTVVGERGLTLSGGQRQRIALARAILSDPRILILDDATSAIDAKIEEAIHDGLRGVMAGRTTLLVAHRRSTLHLADRIVVLGGGPGGRAGHATTSSWRAAPSTGPCCRASRRTRPSRSATGSRRWPRWPPGRGRRHDRVGLEAGAPGDAIGAPVVRTIGAPSIGAGLGGGGGGGGGGGWRLNLAPTPELLARVAALRPVRDVADRRPGDRVAPRPRLQPDRGCCASSAGRCSSGWSWSCSTPWPAWPGPILVKTGIDNGVAKGSEAVLFAASAVFLVITLADMVDEIGETFVTGRAAQRIMLSLRIRIWAQLQRLSLDYYESEMAGRIMTRMTTDVDQFESLIENGLLSALVSMVTFVGVGVALVVINIELGLCTLTVVVPLAVATVVFRRRAARLYDLSRERIAIVNADFQESLSGVRVSQAFVHEAETDQRFRRLGRDYLESRVAAQRLVAIYFPFVQFLSGVADAIVLGVGAGLIASGHLTSGALIAFILYIDLFFSPIQQLSQVFDSWQQTRVSVGRIADLMQLETPDPGRPPTRSMPGRLRGRDRPRPGALRLPAVTAPALEDGASPGWPSAAGPRTPASCRLPTPCASKPPEALRGIDLRHRGRRDGGAGRARRGPASRR